MHLTNYARSTPFQLALALTATFFFAFVIAGAFVFFAVDENLDERIAQAAEMTASGFEDRYASVDVADFIAAVEARTAAADSDDEMLWLGNTAGEKFAGVNLTAPLVLEPGDVFGGVLRPGLDDQFRVAIRDIGELRLIAAVSYEDADEVRSEVLLAFGWATLFVVLVASTAAALLARRGQKRIEEISKTLRAVSLGTMSARVPVTSSKDDLERLALNINEALSRLQTTVDGIRQVSMSIAHDLRTPINRLGILLEQLPLAKDVSFEARRDEAQNEIRTISQTFDSLLRIAKMESGVANKNFDVVDLSGIAKDLFETYQLVAEEEGQSLLYAPGSHGSIKVQGDRVLLFQLFSNLVENAIRHCPQATTIQIDTGVKGNTPWMSVGDNGPGIPIDEQDNVLRAFYRLDESRYTPGSGLGLALVKSICHLHGVVLLLKDNEPGLLACVEFKKINQYG